MTTEELKDHLNHYSYYRYMKKTEPEEFLPLYKMVKKWLFFLPKCERKVLFLRYCLHRTSTWISVELDCSRMNVYRMEKQAFERLCYQFCM
ncbi:MAG TPA: hypothetical protein VFC68_05000 [Treponemataceae bacterium]|nr:hypothetical protein [Treponemataceae bacterium]